VKVEHVQILEPITINTEVLLVVDEAIKNGEFPWIERNTDWQNNLQFIQELLATGGLPRALEYLLQNCTNSKCSLANMPWETVKSITLSQLGERYGFLRGGSVCETLALQALLGDAVHMDTNLKGTNVSYDEMFSRGFAQFTLSSNKYKVQVPLLWMDWFLGGLFQEGHLHKGVFHSLCTLKAVTWQKFEEVCAQILFLRLQAIKYDNRKLSLNTLFPGALTSEQSWPDLELPSAFNVPQSSSSKFLQTLCDPTVNWYQLEGIKIQGTGSPAFDAFVFFKISGKNEYMGLFLQMRFTQAGQTFITPEQMKNMKEEIMDEWKAMKKHTHKKYHQKKKIASEFLRKVTTIKIGFISNHPYKSNSDLGVNSIPDDCFLICDSNMGNFFSCWTPQLKFQSLKNQIY
jgi:hypothetical protein